MKQWANRFIWFLLVPMKRVFIALFLLIAVSIIPVSAFLPGNPTWKYIASSPKKIFLFDQTLYHIRDLGENNVMFTIGIRERQLNIFIVSLLLKLILQIHRAELLNTKRLIYNLIKSFIILLK